MEALITSETSANVYENTLRNILIDCHLHTRRHENLKSEILGYLTCNQHLNQMYSRTRNENQRMM
jgi:hypothetical protein